MLLKYDSLREDRAKKWMNKASPNPTIKSSYKSQYNLKEKYIFAPLNFFFSGPA